MKYLSFNVSELGYIAEYAKVGKIDGALYMEVPDEVYNNPVAYMYVNGEFIDNPDYVEPTLEDDSVDYDEVILDHEYRISMIELGV